MYPRRMKKPKGINPKQTENNNSNKTEARATHDLKIC
jgi:hypothetical protein